MDSEMLLQYWLAVVAIVSVLAAATFSLISIWIGPPGSGFSAKVALSAFIVFLLSMLLQKVIRGYKGQ